MRFLYKAYQLFFCLPLFLLATIATSLITCVGSLLGSASFWGYHPGKWWSRFTCRLLLLPIRVEGREHLDARQSYVFVANHQGPFDIFLIYGFLGRNFKWMMKKSLRKVPFVGVACEKARHIFVDKSSPHAIAATQEAARRTLQGGMSLVVFPEGSRTFTGHMGVFRRGAFQLAAQLGLPVVPVTIDGSFDVLTRMAGFNFVHRHRMRLVIHQPLPPAPDASAESIRALLETSYAVIMSDLPERHQGFVENKDQ